MTLLGCVAVVAIPMPVVFLLYGKKIRARSKFAPAYDLKMERQKKDEETGSSGSEDLSVEKENNNNSEGGAEQEKNEEIGRKQE